MLPQPAVIYRKVPGKVTYKLSSFPLKLACTISWNATASGIVSAMPIVSGEGPRDPIRWLPPRLLSRLPILSVLDMAGDGEPVFRWPRPSGRGRDGGLEIVAVGVGVLRRCCAPAVDFGIAVAAGCMSPISANRSPKSATAGIIRRIMSKFCTFISHTFTNMSSKWERAREHVS